MISSLEGKKGQPKLKPPFPAVQGYLGKPTIVNNVETLAAVVPIVRDGAEAYLNFGTKKIPRNKNLFPQWRCFTARKLRSGLGLPSQRSHL